jgi:hypothetical protein
MHESTICFRSSGSFVFEMFVKPEISANRTVASRRSPGRRRSAGTPASALPQLPQNFAPGRLVALHVGHVCRSDVPQFVQKR